VSTRGYARSLEPLPKRSRYGRQQERGQRAVRLWHRRKLAELMSRELRQLRVVALLIDGVHFGEHVCWRQWGR